MLRRNFLKAIGVTIAAPTIPLATGYKMATTSGRFSSGSNFNIQSIAKAKYRLLRHREKTMQFAFNYGVGVKCFGKIIHPDFK